MAHKPCHIAPHHLQNVIPRTDSHYKLALPLETSLDLSLRLTLSGGDHSTHLPTNEPSVRGLNAKHKEGSEGGGSEMVRKQGSPGEWEEVRE